MSDDQDRGTYRERRLAKADRYEEWAGKRQAKSDAAAAKSSELAGLIPFGQPVIVGHHSEARHRSHLKRIRGNMERAIEHGDKAASMASRAATIRAQADHAIYQDDPDALQRLQAKLADLEAQRTGIREYNKTCRRGTPDVSLLHPVQAKELERAAGNTTVLTHITRPDGSLAPYIAANLGVVITATRKRIAKLEAKT